MSDPTQSLGADGNERRTSDGEIVTGEEERRTEEQGQPDTTEAPEETPEPEAPEREAPLPESPDYRLPDTAPLDPMSENQAPSRQFGEPS